MCCLGGILAKQLQNPTLLVTVHRVSSFAFLRAVLGNEAMNNLEYLKECKKRHCVTVATLVFIVHCTPYCFTVRGMGLWVFVSLPLVSS